MKSHSILFFILTVLISFSNGCTAVRTVAKTVEYTGKAAEQTFKAGKAAVELTGTAAKTTWNAGKATTRFLKGKKTIPLERVGNTLYVEVVLNNKTKAKLVLDTGASSVQISRAKAKKAGIPLKNAKRIRCILADGSTTYANKTKISKIELSGLTLKNIEVIVLEQEFKNADDGLLGMSLLQQFNVTLDLDNNLLILK